MRETVKMTKLKNNQKGITLIALVITIIVLLILAGVAISMLSGENGILRQAADAKVRTEEKTEIERVQLAVLSALTAGKGEVDLSKGSDKENSIDKALNEEFGNEIKKPTYEEGKITLSNGKEYTVTSSGKLTQPDGPSSTGKQWSLPEGDTEVNVGDLLTPTVEGLETEKFYVIADDGTTLTLLAERCVNTSTNKQVDSGYTTVEFDSSSNAYNGSDIQGLVNAYVGTLNKLDLEDVEVAYGGDAVTGVKGRLMWYEEANPLGATYNNMIYGPSAARINYWLGSPSERGTDIAWIVGGCDEVLYSDLVIEFCDIGLRPVIKILKSNV